jgi:hypothetical protein
VHLWSSLPPCDPKWIAYRCDAALCRCCLGAPIEVGPKTFERVRQNPLWYIVAPGHEQQEGDGRRAAARLCHRGEAQALGPMAQAGIAVD